MEKLVHCKQFDTGFTCGTFDLLHAGHVLMLEEAKQYCDHLIVGLQVDPTIDRPQKNSPIQSIFERQVQLKGCRFVDSIVTYNTEADLLDILQALTIDVRFVGEEYSNKDFTGKEYCLKNNIAIVYKQRKHRFSSSELRNRIQVPTAFVFTEQHTSQVLG